MNRTHHNTAQHSTTQHSTRGVPIYAAHLTSPHLTSPHTDRPAWPAAACLPVCQVPETRQLCSTGSTGCSGTPGTTGSRTHGFPQLPTPLRIDDLAALSLVELKAIAATEGFEPNWQAIEEEHRQDICEALVMAKARAWVRASARLIAAAVSGASCSLTRCATPLRHLLPHASAARAQYRNWWPK